MTNEQFDCVLDARLDSICRVLAVKAGEYATDSDRLHNFKVSAGLVGTSPAQEAHAFMRKHVVSILDLIKWVESPAVIPDNLTTEQLIGRIREKVGDAINYMILIEAILIEVVLNSRHISGDLATYLNNG